MIKMFCARGSLANWLFCGEMSASSSGSNDQAIVSAPATFRPSLVVAAKERFRARSSGIRNVAVQPAPRMRRWCSCMLLVGSRRRLEKFGRGEKKETLSFLDLRILVVK